jgi:hypothetical protein
MYAGLGNTNLAVAVRETMVMQLCVDAGRPGNAACIQRARELLGTKSRDEVITELREGPSRKWLLWGAVGAGVLVVGALVLTR